MKTKGDTIEFQARIPVWRETEVLVVGGGAAGIAAAIAAARNGARTTLVERYGFLGGTATASLVGPFMTSFSQDGKTRLIRGIFQELVERIHREGGAVLPETTVHGTAHAGYIRRYGPHQAKGFDRVAPVNADSLKRVAAEMCLEAGATLLLHTSFVTPLLDGRTVTGSVIHNKSGLQAIRARVTIDCSADADVAYRAGAPTVFGRESDGRAQPMSMFFRIRGVDRQAVETYYAAHPEETRLFQAIVNRARAEGRLTVQRDGVYVFLEPDGETWRVNTSRIIGRDGTNAEDLTAAEIEGRRQVAELMGFFRRECPGFEHCTLVEVAPQVGVRESRRIVGEYVLTAEDLASGRDFPDTIAFCGYPIDIHDPAGWRNGGDHPFRAANAYQIPFRSLVPRGVEQLLVAGRSLSATHEAAASVRVMPPCFAMGEAAGTAAALALKAGVPVRSVEIAELRRCLRQQGVYLGDGE